MLTNRVEKVRGMNDVLTGDYYAYKHIESKLTECFESFGYAPIELPVIEHTDLYLRKSGEDIVGRLYDFTYQNRRLCLRPEMTASAIRAYIDNFQGSPLPARLFYSGPVFRYERPQKGRQRQFTQTGVELLGASGPTADAEVIGMACKGLGSLEVNQYQVSVGHVGILAEFLEHLRLDNRIKSFLLANIETIRENGSHAVLQRLMEKFPAYQPGANQSLVIETQFEQVTLPSEGSENLAHLISRLDDAEARSIIMDLLYSMDIELDSSRPPDEIVSRLLEKINRRHQAPLQINHAIQFLGELCQLKGDVNAILKEAERLLLAYNIDLVPLQQLHSIMALLDNYDIDKSKISLDLGLSRGLQYYTGTIFEIYHNIVGEETQLCGGGRYDDLVVTFGGKSTVPGSGFAYGIERLKAALEDESRLLPKVKSVSVLLVPVSIDDYPSGIRISEALRKQGLSVEMDVRNRSVTSNFQYANRQHIPFVIVLGSEERLTKDLRLKKMATGEEFQLDIANTVTLVKESINHVD